MNQFKTSNFTVLKTHKIRCMNTVMTFEVQGDSVRMRQYPNVMDISGYLEKFHIAPTRRTKPRTIEADVWYDIGIAREIYAYMTRKEDDTRLDVYVPVVEEGETHNG